MTEIATRFALRGFGGQLLHPGDAGYDDARQVFNGMFDRRPALIARCVDAEDVAAVVRLARDQRLPLSVYGGGHAVTGSAVCDAGICADLRPIKAITVDPVARIARAEAGLTWGEFDAATQEHGLAVTGGRVSSTGIAGLALGSGSGWLERKLGLTGDNLVRAEVVTATGDHVVASAEENADLFWGLRGGGGNFGIVTAFHFRLHPIGPILLAGMLLYPSAMARDLVRFWRDFMLDAPDEVNAALAFITAPPEEFVPEPVRGHPVVGMLVSYNDSLDDAEDALRPLREFGPPAVDLVQPMPYVALQQMQDMAFQKGMRNYWTADFFAEFPDDAVEVFLAHATNPVSPLSQMILAPCGGAIARVDDDATAFGQRGARFFADYMSRWADPADTEQNIAYTRAIAAAMKPWTTGRICLNFIGNEGAGRVETAFGSAKYARLQALKAKWDPENLFRQNQNIPPALPNPD